MEGYLGEVDVTSHYSFKEYSREDFAMVFITKYGQIDGEHHKAWVLDQVARILKGTPVIVSEASWSNGETEIRYQTGEPSEEYREWQNKMLGSFDSEIGEYDYWYDCGIAP